MHPRAGGHCGLIESGLRAAAGGLGFEPDLDRAERPDQRLRAGSVRDGAPSHRSSRAVLTDSDSESRRSPTLWPPSGRTARAPQAPVGGDPGGPSVRVRVRAAPIGDHGPDSDPSCGPDSERGRVTWTLGERQLWLGGEGPIGGQRARPGASWP